MASNLWSSASNRGNGYGCGLQLFLSCLRPTEKEGGRRESFSQAHTLERGALKRECHCSLAELGQLKHQKLERRSALRTEEKKATLASLLWRRPSCGQLPVPSPGPRLWPVRPPRSPPLASQLSPPGLLLVFRGGGDDLMCTIYEY